MLFGFRRTTAFRMGTESFTGVKSSRGVTLTPHPLLVPWSGNSRAIPLLPPMDRTACTEPQCLYNGALFYLLLLEGYQTSAVCPCGKSNVLKQVSVERW